MKKHLSLVLALVMILGTFTSVFAADADAVEEASDFLADEGVLVGNMEGDLMLDEYLSRQDTVVLVARLMGELDVAEEFPTSEDIPTYEDIDDDFYLPMLAWAQANETFVGHSEVRFGFDDNTTAQEYAKVLLVALGYEVGDEDDKDFTWDEVLEEAKDLGIAKDLDADIEDNDEIERSEMAVMTFNALGVTMKDSDKTLAEELDIEMPSAADLTVEDVRSENLREVLVELSNADLADLDDLKEENNYRVDGDTAERVTVDGDTLIVELKETLDEDDDYDLKIRNIDSDVDGTYEFTARDNSIPRVEEVEALGKYGIKITMSEPVRDVYERDFLIDNRNISMETEQYGRVIILTPYSGSFSSNAEEVTVKSLEDYAGFKSSRADFDIEIVKDEVAPEVTDVIVRGDLVEVTFDKDIYIDSVEEYENRSDVGNISYREGRRTFYAEEGADKIDVDKVEYEFKEELPRNAEVTIEGVENHSGIAMDRTTEEVREVIDYTEPEVLETDVETLNSEDGRVEIELTFSKDVNFKDDEINSDKAFENHFNLYNYGEVRDRNEIELGDEVIDGKDFELVSVDYDGNDEDVVILEVEGLVSYDSLTDDEQDDFEEEEFDYVLEIKDFEDARSSRNRMFRYYLDFEVDEDEDFVVEGMEIQDGYRRYEKEIILELSKAVDRRTADVLENYTFTNKNGEVEDLDDLDGEVEYQKGSEEIVLIIPDYNDQDLETLHLSSNIKDDEDGNRLSGPYDWDLTTEEPVEDELTEDEKAAKKVDDIIYNLPQTVNMTQETLEDDKAAIAEARAAYEDLTDDQKDLVERLDWLEAKEAKVAELEADEELDMEDLNAAKAAAEELDEADYTEETWAEVEDALNLPETTQTEVDAKTTAINDAIEALVEVELEDDELAGEFEETPFGEIKVIKFQMPDGNTEIESAEVNDVATDDFNVSGGTEGRVIVDEATDTVKVVIDGMEYTIVVS